MLFRFQEDFMLWNTEDSRVNLWKDPQTYLRCELNFRKEPQTFLGCELNL